MEIADILVVNKATSRTPICSRASCSIVDACAGARRTPILKTAGALNEGIDELADAIDEHRAYIAPSEVREAHRLEQARHQVLALARQRLIDRLLAHHATDGRFDALVARVAERELTRTGRGSTHFLDGALTRPSVTLSHRGRGMGGVGWHGWVGRWVLDTSGRSVVPSPCAPTVPELRRV